MARPTRFVLMIVILFFLTVFPLTASAGPVIAFSLKQAERVVKGAAGRVEDRVRLLGGITRVVGMVYDRAIGDLIIVGQTEDGNGSIFLDDLVVALRTRMVHNTIPLVSIDKTRDTDRTGKQQVRFEGGIENTHFGRKLLEADIILKKLALGVLPGEVWGVPSYFARSAEGLRKGDVEEDHIGSQFWFELLVANLASREGVFVVKELGIAVKTKVMSAVINNKRVVDLSKVQDKIGDSFSRDLTVNLADISIYYPEFARIKPMFDLVGLALGVEQASLQQQVDYWLHHYKVSYHETPKEYELIVQRQEIPLPNKVRILTIDGGVALKALMIRLRDGDVTALKEIVLKSRPHKDALSWKLPITGWRLPGDEDVGIIAAGDTLVHGKPRDGAGCYIGRQIAAPGQAPSTLVYSTMPGRVIWVPTSRDQLPKVGISDKLTSQGYSTHVGGVMLQGTASVAGAKDARVELGKGQFSLIVDGKNAQLEPQAFRKFVTALWAVYFSRMDPGISIDPIEPGGKKHLVRYIGKVINADLGRVMREADYLMKQWAVGTSRPNVQGFLNPDDISGRRGTLYYGVSSRFWFVPEDMRFKEGNGMLLYDSGRMRVKTEFNLQNHRGMKSDPSNEQFAAFLTENYEKLSEHYPVLGELLEYAKLVQLARYLKESGVPLFWFLMANKDLVLTEDSPGTVDALAKGSDYFKNISIEGGVDLATRGQYVFDQTAVKAVNQALSHLPAYGTVKTSLGSAPAYVPGNFSFELKGQSYSTVPQSSLTSGKDRRGIRYQTDLAMRGEGFELGDKAIKSLRPEIFRRQIAHKLRPVIEGMSEKEVKARFDELLNRAGEESKGVVDSLLYRLSALKNKEHGSEAEFSSALEGLIGSEAVRRFGDLIVKQAHYVTNLELVRYFHPQRQTNDGEFGTGWHFLIPYRMKPAGSERRRFLNALIPAKMEILNLFSGEKEVLTFSEDHYSIAGYVPDKVDQSQLVGLFLLSDGSYRMADKLGNEFQFDQEGYLTEMVFSEDCRTKIEYGFRDTTADPLYELWPDRSQYESYQYLRLPKRMTLRDLSTGKDEVMVFNKENQYGIIGYTPETASGSRYRFLALMSDGSFVLSDNEGNEACFDPSGKWTRARFKVVTALSQGQFRIELRHDFKTGKPRVVEASVMRHGRTTPIHTAKYEYGQDQRLARVVVIPSSQQASLPGGDRRLAGR